jgi:phage baseplate assembly protein gpV
MYVGGLGSLNGTPTQYIQFTDAGVTIHSPGGITINAPTVTIQGDIVATGTITSNGKRIDDTHKHISVSVGTGVSGVPQ